MTFDQYIGISPEQFKAEYIDAGFVDVQRHNEFPLSIYNYSRLCVHKDKWDGVTSKCRGIIVNNETGHVVARPFEKFHNYGYTSDSVSTAIPEDVIQKPATLWEKMDGFMVTGYQWAGQWYAASKGSFHSIHAKWATQEIRKLNMQIPDNWTPVFEGLHPDLRVVVDYGDRSELVLLALINNESGSEVYGGYLEKTAELMGVKTPQVSPMKFGEAVTATGREGTRGFEGFVATWYRPNKPPFRVKLKYIEYLRLHRIVTGVSPKRIWEMLANNWTEEIHELEESPAPGFAAFAKKWIRVLRTEHDNLERDAKEIYGTVTTGLLAKPFANSKELRKAYAAEFTRHPIHAPILFAMLDKKDVDVVIWGRVKEASYLKGTQPLVDAHNT